MGKDKLRKFAEFSALENSFEYPEHMMGKWHEFFKNDHPITLELACGKAEYTVGLARIIPQENFIGVDVKGNRIWRGAKTALEEQMNNTAFVRAQIDHIDRYFAPLEVQHIWITFADPRPGNSSARKRLTHPMFLNRYRKICGPDSCVFLKTDSSLLFDYSKFVANHYGLELVHQCENVYAWDERPEYLNIITHYESMWLQKGKTIKFLQFRLPQIELNWKEDLPNFNESTYARVSAET